MTITALAPRDLMTVDEVADETRRTVASVRWLIHSKQLKSGKVGGRRLVRREDLEAFINAGFEEAG